MGKNTLAPRGTNTQRRLGKMLRRRAKKIRGADKTGGNEIRGREGKYTTAQRQKFTVVLNLVLSLVLASLFVPMGTAII